MKHKHEEPRDSHQKPKDKKRKSLTKETSRSKKCTTSISQASIDKTDIVTGETQKVESFLKSPYKRRFTKHVRYRDTKSITEVIIYRQQ